MGQYVFKLPDVGEGTAEAEIVAWHVRVGDIVKEDAPLVDVMTDKATVEMTSPVSGKIVSLHGEPGEMAPVGSAIAIFETEAEAANANGPRVFRRASPSSRAAASRASAAAERRRNRRARTQAAHQGARRRHARRHRSPRRSPPAPKPAPQASQSVAKREPTEPTVREMGQAQASPAVRARAQKLGIDLAAIRGSGPDGRITHEDLDKVLVPVSGARVGASQLAERNNIEPVKVIGLRRKIAEKMQDAKRRIPHFAYVEECDLTELEELRAHLNATRRAGSSRSSQCCRS